MKATPLDILCQRILDLEADNDLQTLEKSDVYIRPDYNEESDMEESDMALLKSGIADLKSDVTEIKSDVTEIKSDVTEIKSDVTEIKSDISALKSILLAIGKSI